MEEQVNTKFGTNEKFCGYYDDRGECKHVGSCDAFFLVEFANHLIKTGGNQKVAERLISIANSINVDMVLELNMGEK